MDWCILSSIRFQIWRPQDDNENGTDSSVGESKDSKELSLVAELPVIPSVVYSREDVSSKQNCSLVV